MIDRDLGVLYVNGRKCAAQEPSISALDRGFTLGDGVFETMRAHGGNILRLGQHLERLRRGASLLKIPFPSQEKLTAALEQILSEELEVELVLRLTLTRGVDFGRGVVLPGKSVPTLAIRATSYRPPSKSIYLKGFCAAVSSVRRNENSPLSSVKSCNYVDSILARLEVESLGAQEAILLNQREQAVCASTANLFLFKDGILYTPAEKAGALSGITRSCILECTGPLGITTSLSSFGVNELREIDEAFLCNTVLGVMPLTKLGENPVGSGRPGFLTQELSQAFETLIDKELKI